MSYAFYIVLLAVVILSICIKYTKSKILLLVLVTILSLFSGLRSNEVGNDTLTYFNILKNLQLGVYTNNVEYGFLVYSKTILNLTNNPTSIFLVSSFIINGCILFRFWLGGNINAFPIECIWYYVFLFPQSCNIMRQYLAASIVFLSTVLLNRKRYGVFIIAVLIATTIHFAVVISLVLIPIYILFSNKTVYNDRKKMVISLFFLIPVILLFILFAVHRYQNYLIASPNGEIGLLNIIRLIIVFFYIGTNIQKFIYPQNYQSDVCSSMHLIPIAIYYLFGIVLTSLGYYFTTMSRLGLLFMFFEPMFVGQIISVSRNKNIYIILYIILFVIYFYINVQAGWSGLSNYSIG